MNWQGLFATVIKIVAVIRGLSVIAGPWNAIKAIPTVVGLIRDILKLVQDVSDYTERLKKLKEFQKAIETAKTTGSTSELEKLFGGTGK